MATAKQIIAMLRSHNQGDSEQFLSIALQVAAAEADRGRNQVAEQLRKLVDSARSKQDGTAARKPSSAAIPIARPRGELQNLLDATYPRNELDDVVLPKSTRDWLDRLVHQQRQRDRLRAFGQSPSTRVLLAGPPGSGKTLTASAIAGELHLPLFSVRLESVITRYMGETAAKLRLIFDQISETRGVYLFDEFDAIGGRRTAENDVGEMRRVLNSFLQFLEEPNATDSLIIAATNHPELLDRALFRRFDRTLQYQPPDHQAIKTLVTQTLGSFRPKNLSWDKIITASNGLSLAEISKAVREAIKTAILDEKKVVSVDGLVSELQDRQANFESYRHVP